MHTLSTQQLQIRIGDTRVCRDLNLEITPGSCWAVLGGNGTGKTTLLHTLAGLRAPEQGQVILEGKPLDAWTRRAIAQRLGLMLQDSHDVFPASVLDTAVSGRHPHRALWQGLHADDYARATQALDAVGLSALAQRDITTLSGGERRRLAFATLQVQDPTILLLDEPSNHLDLHQQIRLLQHLQTQVQQESKAVLMSLHDVNLAARFCTHCLLLFGHGEFLQGSCAEVLTTAQLERLYQHPIREVKDSEMRVFMPA